jgi:hypothetical protein
MRILQLTLAFIISLLCLSNEALAVHSVQVSGSYLSMSPKLSGAEASTTVFFRGKQDRSFFLGPKFGAYLVQGSDYHQSAFFTGIESVVWLVNAVGLGSSFEVIAPLGRGPAGHETHDSQLMRIRVSPYISFRYARLAQNGAWSMRLGIPYDTIQKWGIQVGLSLQFSGVPRVGWDQEKKN